MHNLQFLSLLLFILLNVEFKEKNFPGGSDDKTAAYNTGDRGSILGQEDPLEKEMATHSSALAWKIPWMEESHRLQSMGSQRVGRDWATSLSLFIGDKNVNLPFSSSDRS